MARHKSAYFVQGIGLSLPATPRSADNVKGAMAMRYIEPAGVVSAVMRRRTIPGTKANVLMMRSGRAETLHEILSSLCMVCCFGQDWVLMRVVVVRNCETRL